MCACPTPSSSSPPCDRPLLDRAQAHESHSAAPERARAALWAPRHPRGLPQRLPGPAGLLQLRRGADVTACLPHSGEGGGPAWATGKWRQLHVYMHMYTCVHQLRRGLGHATHCCPVHVWEVSAGCLGLVGRWQAPQV